jgi:hypothetical protein
MTHFCNLTRLALGEALKDGGLYHVFASSKLGIFICTEKLCNKGISGSTLLNYLSVSQYAKIECERAHWETPGQTRPTLGLTRYAGRSPIATHFASATSPLPYVVHLGQPDLCMSKTPWRENFHGTAPSKPILG